MITTTTIIITVTAPQKSNYNVYWPLESSHLHARADTPCADVPS